MTSHKNDLLYKVLLVGESGVGKTSLIRSLTGCPFTHNMLTTVGIDFVKVPFDVDGASVTLQIWDTAGQERFRSLTKFQYRGTKGLLLVYDVTNKKTFETLSYWMASIEQELELEEGEPVPVVVVGNKKDLQGVREVAEEEGRKLSEKYFLAGFFETSAYDGNNVQECFQKLASSIVDVYNPEQMNMYRISAEITTLKRSAVFPEEQIKNLSILSNRCDINNNNKKKKDKKKKRDRKNKNKSSCKSFKLPTKPFKLNAGNCECGKG